MRTRSLFIISCDQEAKANLNPVAEINQDFEEQWIGNDRIVRHHYGLRLAGVKIKFQVKLKINDTICFQFRHLRLF